MQRVSLLQLLRLNQPPHAYRFPLRDMLFTVRELGAVMRDNYYVFAAYGVLCQKFFNASKLFRRDAHARFSRHDSPASAVSSAIIFSQITISPLCRGKMKTHNYMYDISPRSRDIESRVFFSALNLSGSKFRSPEVRVTLSMSIGRATRRSGADANSRTLCLLFHETPETRGCAIPSQAPLKKT